MSSKLSVASCQKQHELGGHKLAPFLMRVIVYNVCVYEKFRRLPIYFIIEEAKFG